MSMEKNSMKVFLIFGWLMVGLLFFAPLSFAVESDVDRLLELLVAKGVLTQEDAANFRADLAVKKQEEKETQKEFAVIAGKPLKLSGYTQVRYQRIENNNNTFDVRRARLDIKGDITERFGYQLQTEFAGSSPKILDANLGYNFNPYIKLTAGQFKVPFSQENLIGDQKLETINRAQVVEALTARGTDVIGNQNGRDIGAQLSGSIFPKNDYNLLDYAFGIFNGAGINTSDTNEQKDFVGRLVFHPLKDLSVGTSYYNGRYTLSSVPARRDERDRIGGEFTYTHDRFSLKSEYIQGIDAATKKDGWYLQGSYFFIPNKLQGVFKFDTYDPNNKVKKNETNVYTLGGNWYFNKWAYLQLDYELKDETGKEIDNDVLSGQMTLQF